MGCLQTDSNVLSDMCVRGLSFFHRHMQTIALILHGLFSLILTAAPVSFESSVTTR